MAGSVRVLTPLHRHGPTGVLGLTFILFIHFIISPEPVLIFSIDGARLFLHLASDLAVHVNLPVDVELVVLEEAPPLRVASLHVSHHLPQLLPRLSRLLGKILRYGYNALPDTFRSLQHVLLVFEVLEGDCEKYKLSCDVTS